MNFKFVNANFEKLLSVSGSVLFQDVLAGLLLDLEILENLQ